MKELSLDRLVELIEDNIPDPRRPGGNIRHKLVDLFVIILLGIICGCETRIDIEDYAKAKVEWLKTFLELPGGIPSNDTYRRLMERIRPEILEKVYRQWVLPYVGGCVGKHICELRAKWQFEIRKERFSNNMMGAESSKSVTMISILLKILVTIFAIAGIIITSYGNKAFMGGGRAFSRYRRS